MRRAVLALTCALAACRGIGEPRGVTGVAMKLDASCAKIVPQPRPFSLFVDNVLVGTATLALGGTSDTWAIVPGSHTFVVRSPDVTWNAAQVDVPVEGVIYVLQCPFVAGLAH